MQSEPKWEEPDIKKYEYKSIQAAADASLQIGCEGHYYKLPNGKYIPCKSISTLKKTVGIPKIEKVIFNPSNFETIDYSVYNWVDNVINVSVNSNTEFSKVPVIWLTSERSYQVKKNKELRQVGSDSLIFPLISIKRSSTEKAEMSERPIPGNIFKSQHSGRDYKANPFYLSKKINQEKTKNFANATSLRLNKQVNFTTPKNQRIIYKRYWVPLPIYYNLTYSINLRTDYQQQMNEMLQPFAVYTNNINSFLVFSEYHKYEAFIDINYAFSNNMSTLAGAEKLYETTISLKVLGYVFGADKNQEGPTVSYKENAVEIKIQRERVILGDINEFNEKEGYRR